MAAMTTALTEFADNGNSRTYTYTGHTAVEPRLVLQKRKTAAGGAVMLEDRITVLSSTEDSAGELLTNNVTFEVIVRRPKDGIAGDVTAGLAVFRDVIAGDEFTNTVSTQEWLT